MEGKDIVLLGFSLQEDGEEAWERWMLGPREQDTEFQKLQRGKDCSKVHMDLGK